MPDADTVHNPDLIKQNKFNQIHLGTGKITDLIKFNNGNLCMGPGGANQGSTGVITRDKEKWVQIQSIFLIYELDLEGERERRNQGFLPYLMFSFSKASLALTPVIKNHKEWEVKS